MGRSGQPFDLSPADDVFHLLRTESKAESHKWAAAEAGLAEHLQGGKAAFGDGGALETFWKDFRCKNNRYI